MESVNRETLWETGWFFDKRISISYCNKSGMTTYSLSISSGYGGHLENDERLVTISSYGLSSFCYFFFDIHNKPVSFILLD